MRNVNRALVILVIGVSACTTVEGVGEVTVDVSTTAEVQTDEDTVLVPDSDDEDGAVSVDTSEDLLFEDLQAPDLTEPDSSVADVTEDATPDVPEECEDGGCFLQPCDEPSDCPPGQECNFEIELCEDIE